MPDQNRCSSVRVADGGRPGEGKGGRPDRSDLRRLIPTATSFVRVLRRPFESAQYASEAYRGALATAGITPSMSRKGDCWDNAPMESFFHTLKTERVHHRLYATRAEARRDLFGYIEGFYNSRRLHSALGYISPVEMERRAA